MLITLTITRSALLTGYVYTSTIINIPIRGQIVNILSAVEASIRLVPLLGASAVGSFVAGAASFRKNNTFWTLSIACCFMMLGSGLMSTLDITVYTQAKQYGYEVLLGFGIGLTFSTTTIIAGLNTQFIHHGKYLHTCHGFSTKLCQLNLHIYSCLPRRHFTDASFWGHCGSCHIYHYTQRKD